MTSIPYDVTGISNGSSKATILQNYILSDLQITTSLKSVVYDGEENLLIITFNDFLSSIEAEIIDTLFHTIALENIPGIDLYIDKPRRILFGAVGKPTVVTDYNAGFTLGSMIYFGDMIFVCTTNTIGAAHWSLINSNSSPLGFLSFATGSPSITKLPVKEYLIGSPIIPYDNRGIARNCTFVTDSENNTGFSWSVDEQVSIHGKICFYVPQSVVTDVQKSQIELYLKKDDSIVDSSRSLCSDQIVKNNLYNLTFDIIETNDDSSHVYKLYLNIPVDVDIAITRYELKLLTV